MSDIFFSICIPSYKSEEFIENAVKSIVSQGYSKYEIIICDQAPTDSSFLLSKYKNVRIIKLDTPSTYNARWELVNAVKGDYFIQLDADDELVDGSLGFLNKVINDTNYKDVYMYLKKDVPQDRRNQNEDNIYSELDRNSFINKCIFQEFGYYNDMLTKCFKNKGKHDYVPKALINNEDGYILLELLNYCESFVVINKILYLHTYRPNSVSKQVRINRLYNQAEYMVYLYNQLGKSFLTVNLNSSMFDFYNILLELYKTSHLAKGDYKSYKNNTHIKCLRRIVNKHFLYYMRRVKAKKYFMLFCFQKYRLYGIAFKRIVKSNNKATAIMR